MPNTDLTELNILDEVTTVLGSSQIDVELVKQDTVKATKDAVRLYNRYVGLYNYSAVTLVSGMTNIEAVSVSAGASNTGLIGNGRGVSGGSVIFTLPINTNSPATIRDNGNSGFTGTDATGAALTISAGSINYGTGVWSLTLGGGVTFISAYGSAQYTTGNRLTGARIQLTEPGLAGIINVEAMSRDEFLGDPDAFEAALFGNRAGIRITGDTHGEYVQQRQYLEQARRFSSSEFEWHAEWGRDGNYYLYYEAAESYSHLSYQYKWHVTPDDNADTGMQHIPDQHVDWIMQYITCRSKQTLGRTLRKFGGIPNPDGGQDPTDGEQLVQEGREDERELREQIKQLRPPIPPLIE